MTFTRICEQSPNQIRPFLLILQIIWLFTVKCYIYKNKFTNTITHGSSLMKTLKKIGTIFMRVSTVQVSSQKRNKTGMSPNIKST